MDIQNTNPNDRFDDPIWYFLAEFTISEFISDDDRSDEFRAGFDFQAIQELSMSPEWMENIEMTLSGFAKEALVRSKRGGLGLPEQIRVFCQKKIIDVANISGATTRPNDAEQVVEPEQTVFDSGKKKNGGWGYFLIERGKDFTPDSSLNSQGCIDLYLYLEGE